MQVLIFNEFGLKTPIHAQVEFFFILTPKWGAFIHLLATQGHKDLLQ